GEGDHRVDVAVTALDDRAEHRQRVADAADLQVLHHAGEQPVRPEQRVLLTLPVSGNTWAKFMPRPWPTQIVPSRAVRMPVGQDSGVGIVYCLISLVSTSMVPILFICGMLNTTVRPGPGLMMPNNECTWPPISPGTLYREKVSVSGSKRPIEFSPPAVNHTAPSGPMATSLDSTVPTFTGVLPMVVLNALFHGNGNCLYVPVSVLNLIKLLLVTPGIQ